jgi:hypothetical protein
MPTPTDLVTDLPADFEVFGQAVDSSLADLKGGTSGQILAKNSNTDMDFVWIANDQGDITGITASSPLTGGGTSGAVTLGILSGTTSNLGAVQLSDSTSSTSTTLAATANAVKTTYDLANAAIPKSLIDAAGDLIVGTAADTAGRIAIGTNGQVLQSNGTTAVWATPSSGGGYTSIASGTLSSAALNITSIPGTYKALVLELRDITKGSAFDVNMQFNSDSGTNYGNVINRNVNNTLSTIGAIAATAMTINASGFKASTQYNQIIIKIDGYAQTDMWKVCTMYGSGTDYLSSAREIWQGAGTWTSTSAITSIQTDSTMSLKYTLWGLN